MLTRKNLIGLTVVACTMAIVLFLSSSFALEKTVEVNPEITLPQLPADGHHAVMAKLDRIERGIQLLSVRLAAIENHIGIKKAGCASKCSTDKASCSSGAKVCTKEAAQKCKVEKACCGSEKCKAKATSKASCGSEPSSLGCNNVSSGCPLKKQ